MSTKLITVFVAIMIIIVSIGCRKKPARSTDPNQASTTKTELKSQAEYNEMAKKQITQDNMQAELDKVDKEVQQELLQ